MRKADAINLKDITPLINLQSKGEKANFITLVLLSSSWGNFILKAKQSSLDERASTFDEISG